MPILHVMQCTNLGGMEQVSYRLMTDLQSRYGLQFRVVTPRPFGMGESTLRHIDPHSRDFEYHGKYGWRSFRRFYGHLREFTKHCSHIWVTGTCASSLAAIQGFRQPKVLSHHYHHFETPVSGLKWLGFYLSLCHRLDVITYPTRYTRDEALKIAPWLKRRVRLVRNGITTPALKGEEREQQKLRVREKLDLPKDAWIVGNAGWLISRKRFDVFLKTAAMVKRQMPEAYFVICGGGPLENDLKQAAAELGLGERIRFAGWVRNMQDYYRAWDVLLFNSDFDAFGCSPIEAAAQGCLVVSSVRRGGLNEYLRHGENGFLFNNHRIDALADAVIELAENKRLSEQFRQAGYRTLANHYSVEKGLTFFKRFFEN